MSALADLVRNLVVEGRISGVHDVSTGGLAVALAEMAVRSGVGASVDVVPSVAYLFAELPPRVVVAVDPSVVDLVLAEIADAAVPVVRLGVAGGTRLTIAGPEGTWINSPMDQITTTWRDRLPVALGEGTSQA